MLTPTDIHLIVGILSKQASPENVDVILGDMVYDQASGTKRDVDVTIRYKDEKGQEISFVGREVKDHGRKLGSVEVEQLCMKFKDMPSIKRGGIVSASGYTKPAIAKANYHKIDLFDFKDWKQNHDVLQHLKFAENFNLTEITPKFVDKPKVTYLMPKGEDLDYIEKYLVPDLPLVNAAGERLPNINDVRDLNRNLINHALQNESIKEEINELEIGKTKQISITFDITDPPCAILPDKNILLNKATVTGTILMASKELATNFKILVKHNDSTYQVGCAISEMSDKSLVGLSTSNADKKVKLIRIPVTERLKNKIFRVQL